MRIIRNFGTLLVALDRLRALGPYKFTDKSHNNTNPYNDEQKYTAKILKFLALTTQIGPWQ